MTHRCQTTDDQVLARLAGEVADVVWAEELEAARVAACEGCLGRLAEADAFSEELFGAFSEIPFPQGGADRALQMIAEQARGGARSASGGELQDLTPSSAAGPDAASSAPSGPARNVVQAPWAGGWSAALRVAAALLFTTSFVFLGVRGLERAGTVSELARTAPGDLPRHAASASPAATTRVFDRAVMKSGLAPRKKDGLGEERAGGLIAKGGTFGGTRGKARGPEADGVPRGEAWKRFRPGKQGGLLAEGSVERQYKRPGGRSTGSMSAGEPANLVPDDTAQVALLDPPTQSRGQSLRRESLGAPGGAGTGGRGQAEADFYQADASEAGASKAVPPPSGLAPAAPSAAPVSGLAQSEETRTALAPSAKAGKPAGDAGAADLAARERRVEEFSNGPPSAVVGAAAGVETERTASADVTSPNAGAGRALPATPAGPVTPAAPPVQTAAEPRVTGGQTRIAKAFDGAAPRDAKAEEREAALARGMARAKEALALEKARGSLEALRRAAAAAAAPAAAAPEAPAVADAEVLLADGLFWRAAGREVSFERISTAVRGEVTDEGVDAAVVERYASHGQARSVRAIYRIALPAGAEVQNLVIGPASAQALPPSGEAVAEVPSGAEVEVRFRYRQRFAQGDEVQLPFTQGFPAPAGARLRGARARKVRANAANLIVDLQLSPAAQRPDWRWTSNRAPSLVLNNGQAVRVSLRELEPVLSEALRLQRRRVRPPAATKSSR